MKKLWIVALIIALMVLLTPPLSIAFRRGCAFSLALKSGQQEFRAVLPPGRYVLRVSTNEANKALTVVPVHRDYDSEVILKVENHKGLLRQLTNANYGVLVLDDGSGDCFRFTAEVKNYHGERLWLHVRRPYCF